MERFLVCNNPKCHFVLDRHIDGKPSYGAQLILKKCPDCGGDWSATCPACEHPLAVKLVGGLLRSVCCERSRATNARAAELTDASCQPRPNLNVSSAAA